jgi:hypothetical protein
MSRIVKQGVFNAAMHAVQRIKYGRPIPTIFGALLGGCLGALPGLITIHLLAFGIAFGSLIGATIAASFFRRPLSAKVQTDE